MDRCSSLPIWVEAGVMIPRGLGVDSVGDIYLTGSTDSSDFPLAGALQPAYRLTFISKISESANLFVPIVLSAQGLGTSFFTSELTMTNRSVRRATLEFTYTAAFGGGSGIGSDSLPAGRQRIVPDAISYLRSIGLPIPDSGNRGGTLVVRANSGDVAFNVRTTTVVPEGRAVSRTQPFPCRLACRKPFIFAGCGRLHKIAPTLRFRMLGRQPMVRLFCA